jgi:hypothetical protein
MITMSTPTREVPIGVAALILLATSVAGMVATALAGGWWWILFAALALVAAACAYGAVESFQLKHRDDEGNPIP